MRHATHAQLRWRQQQFNNTTSHTHSEDTMQTLMNAIENYLNDDPRWTLRAREHSDECVTFFHEQASIFHESHDDYSVTVDVDVFRVPMESLHFSTLAEALTYLLLISEEETPEQKRALRRRVRNVNEHGIIITRRIGYIDDDGESYYAVREKGEPWWHESLHPTLQHALEDAEAQAVMVSERKALRKAR